eukprot:772641-Amphidinium_carterae.1
MMYIRKKAPSALSAQLEVFLGRLLKATRYGNDCSGHIARCGRLGQLPHVHLNRQPPLEAQFLQKHSPHLYSKVISQKGQNVLLRAALLQQSTHNK